MNEKDYKEELIKSGVDLPELKEEPKVEPKVEEKPEPKVEPKEPASQDDEGKTESEEETEPLKTEPKKRSIYDEYKEKKTEVKTVKTRLEQVEKENEELRVKLEAVSRAETPKEKEEAKDELDAFAEEIGANPEAIKKMQALFLKGIKSTPDESIKKDLDEFKSWKQTHAQVLEKQAFEEEFAKSLPAIKALYPTASEAELNDIKKELDVLSHTKDFHDKELEYVAFKHKEKLSALVSPKKRGMESKSRKDASEIIFEFDPNANYANLSPDQQVEWEKAYKNMSKSDGLVRDANGRKLLI